VRVLGALVPEEHVHRHSSLARSCLEESLTFPREATERAVLVAEND
jgi:hypothetical protein